MRKFRNWAARAVFVVVAGALGVVAWGAYQTKKAIDSEEARA
jgi:hypothetical protein